MSYGAHTVADQGAPLAAMAQIAAAFRHLPAATLEVGAVYPEDLTVRLHDGLDDFEAWREALGIPVDDITFSARPSGITLKARTKFAGAALDLIGYSDALPAPDGGDRS